ncbi:NAD(P)/FAD-dependent oxidoreductase [Aeoliella sp. SH292]|uniref:NAD(P)/FAD-dependent oxidoreductase n=1 Tax=Aeoliella sp. SH292 TaxID=3454464 RepID=UPI003F989D29
MTSSANLWDVVVIGAGPAGAVSAYLAAKAGRRTLLLDANRFPRDKVCGGCLNPRALLALKSIGLADRIERSNPARFDRLELVQRGRSAVVPLPPGVCVTRRAMDQSLVDAAMEAGVTFQPGSRCKVLRGDSSSHRVVRVSRFDGTHHEVRARVVLACDGLGHPSLSDLPGFCTTIHPQSRLGVGAAVESPRLESQVPEGAIVMAVAEQGYVGLARAENNLVNVAAAIDADCVSRDTSLLKILRAILHAAGLDGDAIPDDLPLRGTRPITQHATKLAGERVFVVGDAAGYVEPFTGEGMAAAIEGAIALAPVVELAVNNYSEQLASEWHQQHTRRLRSRQRACRLIAWGVRHPQVLRWSIAGLRHQPRVGEALGRWIGAHASN